MKKIKVIKNLGQIRFSKSIRVKLMLGLGILIIFSLMLVGVYSNYKSSNALEKAIIHELLNKAEVDASQMLTRLQAIEADLRLLANVPPIQGIIRATQNRGRDPLDGSSLKLWQQRLRSIFLNMARYNKHYMQIRFIGANGMELIRVDSDGKNAKVIPPEKLQNKGKKSYFINTAALLRGKVYVSVLDLNMERGKIEQPFKPVIRYGTPVYDSNNLFQGIVIINVFGTHVLDILKEDIGKHVYLINKKGYYLKHPDSVKEWGFMLKRETRLQNDFPEIADLIMSGKKGVQIVDNQILVFAPVVVSADFEIEWQVIYDMDQSTVMAPIADWRLGLFWVSMGILLVSLLSAYFFADRFTKPIREVVQLIDRIALGDLSVKVEVKSEDEIGLLLLSLKKMVETMNSLVGRLSESAMQLNASTNQISATAFEQVQNITTQNLSIQDFSAGVNELAATATELGRNTEQVVQTSRHAIELASQGAGATQSLLTSMERIRNTNEQTASKFSSLIEKVESIEKIVGTITNIADKTNLLSVNASIEAVKAGEFGKGFSVVAAEIRRLADKTVVASQEIADTISDIQKAATTAMSSMENLGTTTKEGIHTVNSAGDSFNALVNIVRTMGPSLEEMKDGTNQQANSTVQMAQSIKEIQQAADESKTGAEQTSETTTSLSSMAHEQLNMVQQFKLSRNDFSDNKTEEI